MRDEVLGLVRSGEPVCRSSKLVSCVFMVRFLCANVSLGTSARCRSFQLYGCEELWEGHEGHAPTHLESTTRRD